MKRCGILLGVGVVLGLGLVACSGGGGQQQAAKSQQEKQQAMAEVGQRVNALQKSITEVKATAEKLGDMAKAKVAKALDGIEKQLAEAKKNTAGIMASQDEMGWREIKLQVDEILKGVETEIAKLKEELGKITLPSLPSVGKTGS